MENIKELDLKNHTKILFNQRQIFKSLMPIACKYWNLEMIFCLKSGFHVEAIWKRPLPELVDTLSLFVETSNWYRSQTV